jgi:hypothetical protein
MSELETKMMEPTPRRIFSILLGTFGVVTAFVLLGRWAAVQTGPVAVALSLVSSVVCILLIASIGEWFIHRYAMHRGRRFPLFRLATELHHRAHHCQHFTPDRYIHSGPIEYPSVLGHGTGNLCPTRLSRALTVSSHAAFYLLFGAPIVGAIWVATANAWFTAGAVTTTIVLIGLFIRVHDAVHYPGASYLEHFRWFWFLDEHHYIHHIDTRANTNFLLPLGDLLMGTLRRQLTQAELMRWPSYAAARKRLFDPVSGTIREVSDLGPWEAGRKELPKGVCT